MRRMKRLVKGQKEDDKDEGDDPRMGRIFNSLNLANFCCPFTFFFILCFAVFFVLLSFLFLVFLVIFSFFLLC